MSDSDEPEPSASGSTPSVDQAEAPDGEDEREPAEELRHNLPLSQFASRDIFNAPVTIGVANNLSRDDEPATVVTWWVLRDEFATPPPRFVEPPHFDALRRLVRGQRFALLVGGGCGGVSVAGAALRAEGHKPVVELPASHTAHGLLVAISQVCEVAPTAGIVVPSIGEDALYGFGATEIRRLHSALGRDGAVVLTTRVMLEASARVHALPEVEAVAPDPSAIVNAHTPNEPDVRERALRGLELLSRDAQVGPGTAVALTEAARANPSVSAEQLAALVSGRSDALDEWFAGRPVAEHVASLAAAVTLDGVPSADVDAAGIRLRHLLEGELEPTSEPPRFGSADRGWPAGVVSLARRPLGTYFGVQDTEVAEVCRPNRREVLLAQLWDRLGPEFRASLIEWLSGLAEHPSPRVRSGTAVAAGILFAKDPMTAERELLRPWALDGRIGPCECAGLAIGVPVLLGSDPSPPRALAYAWSERRSGRNRRRAAITAYGGPLGVWDTGSGAPAHLWRIPEERQRVDDVDAAEDVELQRASDNALAGLVAAGAEARQVRATVIGLLETQAEDQAGRVRAFGLLPTIFRRLTRSDELARASLTALLGDAESSTFSKLTALFARAFDVPVGFRSARAALLGLMDALGAGRIDQDTVNQIIRGMKSGARPGRRSALGQQVERVLAVEARRDTPRGRAANAVYSTFFAIVQEVY